MKWRVVIDLEMCKVPYGATEFRYKYEVIQIGAIKMTEAFEVVGQFSTFVKPQFGRIDKYITDLTGISTVTVQDAPCLGNALRAMMRWIGDDDVIYYEWSQCDHIQIMNELRLKHLSELEWGSILDRNRWIDYQGEFGKKLGTDRQLKLADALTLANMKPEGHLHDGLADAYNTACLISRLEKSKDYGRIIERFREKEQERKPLTTRLGALLSAYGACTA